MISKRDYLWDNLKGLLIFLVVLGHLFHTIETDSAIVNHIIDWIYSFHMPAFLFISGYLAKGYYKDRVTKPKKPLTFLAYYTIFQLLFSLLLEIINPKSKFSFFTPKLGLWYLIAIIVYYLLIPAIQRIPAYVSLPTLVILGMLVGIESKAGNFFAISRILVFAPFFFWGYYSPENLVEKVKNIKFRTIYGLVSFLAGTGLWFAMVYSQDSKTALNLAHGDHNYHSLKVSTLTGIGLRLWMYAIGVLIIIGLILLIPKFKTFLSYLGKNSLQIYVFHLPIIICLKQGLFPTIALSMFSFKWIVVFIVAVIITLLLSTKLFSYPFIWIQRLINGKEQEELK